MNIPLPLEPNGKTMEQKPLEQRVVDRMYGGDAFSQWMGMERVSESPGESILRMTVRPEMTNGFGIAHGGITYSLADSALAFASNGHGVHSVSIETSISHLTRVMPGDVLTAHAKEMSKSNKIGVYHIEVRNQENTLVALFKGMVYRTGKEWDV
jgi:acyl-CoA thioesterase